MVDAAKDLSTTVANADVKLLSEILGNPKLQGKQVHLGRQFTCDGYAGRVPLRSFIKRVSELNQSKKISPEELRALISKINEIDRANAKVGITFYKVIANALANLGFNREDAIKNLDCAIAVDTFINKSTNDQGYSPANIRAGLRLVAEEYSKNHPGEQLPPEFISHLMQALPLAGLWQAHAARFVATLVEHLFPAGDTSPRRASMLRDFDEQIDKTIREHPEYFVDRSMPEENYKYLEISKLHCLSHLYGVGSRELELEDDWLPANENMHEKFNKLAMDKFVDLKVKDDGIQT